MGKILSTLQSHYSNWKKCNSHWLAAPCRRGKLPACVSGRSPTVTWAAIDSKEEVWPDMSQNDNVFDFAIFVTVVQLENALWKYSCLAALQNDSLYLVSRVEVCHTGSNFDFSIRFCRYRLCRPPDVALGVPCSSPGKLNQLKRNLR